MHELSIPKKIIEEIINQSKANKLKEVENATIQLGQLPNYKKEPVQFYFDILKKKIKQLKNTKLFFEEIRATAKCVDCGSKSGIDEAILPLCNYCSSSNVVIISGKEIVIKDIYGLKEGKKQKRS